MADDEKKARQRLNSRRYRERIGPEAVALRWRRYYQTNRARESIRGRIKNWRRLGVAITFDEYERLVNAQGGRCAICGTVPAGCLHLDHDHETGAARGLLCGRCNRGIGHFRDDPDVLAKAAAYAERYRKCRKIAL